MIGSSNTLIDKKGGYIIPQITQTTTNKTFTMTLPYGAEVVASGVTSVSSSNVTMTSTGFISNKEEAILLQNDEYQDKLVSRNL